MRNLLAFIVVSSIWLASLSGVHANTLPLVKPEDRGMDPDHLSLVDSLVYDAIESGETPGAVLAIVKEDATVYRKSYGSMRYTGDTLSMDYRTIFDLASLTKPVATATAIMKLVETGRLLLSDPVSKYLEVFPEYERSDSLFAFVPNMEQLLTHTSGFPSYARVEDLQDNYGAATADSMITYLNTHPSEYAPDSTDIFHYSCPGFIMLQRVVESVTEVDMATWTHRHIFAPLGMDDTFYLPETGLADRLAPTVDKDQLGVRPGIVHDPLAREIMLGVSGNAGLFSTADDLALFAAMMLNEGERNGVRVLSPASVRAMTTLPDGKERFGRGLGWDLSSPYAGNQGDLFGPNAYGHTGYTGTSMVLDPDSRTAVILLTNRVFPDDTGEIGDLRAKVANVVAASVIE